MKSYVFVGGEVHETALNSINYGFEAIHQDVSCYLNMAVDTLYLFGDSFRKKLALPFKVVPAMCLLASFPPSNRRYIHHKPFSSLTY